MIRVVIADDADDLRLLLRMALSRDERFEVVGEAADGVQALAEVDEFDPDLLLLDLAMPVMDGLEVLLRLQDRERPPIVVLSGFTSDDMINKAMGLGAAAYLSKGTPMSGLPDLLADAVAKHTQPS